MGRTHFDYEKLDVPFLSVFPEEVGIGEPNY